MFRRHPMIAVLLSGLLTACQGGAGSGEGGGRKGQASGGEGGAGLLRSLRSEPVVLPEGTVLDLTLETSLSSASSHRGDTVVARLAKDVSVGQRVVLPSGTELRGTVTVAEPSPKGMSGRARLALEFDHVVYKGKDHPIETQAVDVSGAGKKKRDIELIGGGAGAGALIGAIAGGKKGAGIGALVGAGAGTGTVLATTGKDVELPSGSQWAVKITREARLD